MLIENDEQDIRQDIWDGIVTEISADGSEIVVEKPLPGAGQNRNGIRFGVMSLHVTDWTTGKQGKLAVGQRVTVWYHGPLAEVDPPRGLADKIPDRTGNAAGSVGFA